MVVDDGTESREPPHTIRLSSLRLPVINANNPPEERMDRHSPQRAPTSGPLPLQRTNQSLKGRGTIRPGPSSSSISFSF